MQYFTEEFIRFFQELSANNHKEWFHANKKRYEAHVKKPFYQLVGDVIQRIRDEHDPVLALEVKHAVFRINRDIRFSKDKTPYKTHVAAVVSRGGRKNLLEPGVYFHFGLGEASIGGGCYQPDKERLYKLRMAIAEAPEKVNNLLNEKAFKKLYGEIRGEKNKILPKEFKPALEKMPLIANKQFYFMANYAPEEVVLRSDLDDFIVQHYVTAKPWNAFLREAMG